MTKLRRVEIGSRILNAPPRLFTNITFGKEELKRYIELNKKIPKISEIGILTNKIGMDEAELDPKGD